MFRMIIIKKEIRLADISGNNTNYSLSTAKQYATNVRKENRGKHIFVHSFVFVDLETNMYVRYGTGM